MMLLSSQESTRRSQMTNQTVNKPLKLDLKKGKAVGQKIIAENKEWLKEMADK